ncbi:hypothetical protein ACFOUP_05480 [Belliella kenyensis]|uniref:Lipoprotein n=1 Tax=Belliella kenyensis TaxID=1472724 RepID=A0ABV8EJ25_9BACT|nr:hypothetical protein [Belliella kenyensis]MCH7402746.1 hypothetical protein [Belliella kenyensis]MDN3603706.1 hypothetical protein [Belliella kenyensis]
MIRYIINKAIVLFLVLGFAMLACKRQNDKDTNSVSEDRSVEFNESLLLMINGKLYDPDSVLINTIHKKKIVSIVDGVCMKCVINDLNQADLMFREITKENTLAQTIYVLNVPPADSAYFLRHFEPSIDVKGLMLWDHGYTFENTNDLLTADRNLRTFLLDENNFIKFFGHPLYNSKLIEKYKSELIID